MKYSLLFCIAMLLLCGCDNAGKAKNESIYRDVAFQDGNYWITGAVRDDDFSVIVIRKKSDAPNPAETSVGYGFSTEHNNIVFHTTSLPDIIIKPGFGGIYYIKGNRIEFYRQDMTPEFLSAFLCNLETNQTDREFDIGEFCNTIGADSTPVPFNFSDLQ